MIRFSNLKWQNAHYNLNSYEKQIIYIQYSTKQDTNLEIENEVNGYTNFSTSGTMKKMIFTTLNEKGLIKKRKQAEEISLLYRKIYDAIETKVRLLDKPEKDQYTSEVISTLKQQKDSILNCKDEDMRYKRLCNLQLMIEYLSMDFDENSIYKTSYDILKLLILPDRENARDYLRKDPKITPMDKELLEEFGQYTIEALIVHLLGQLYNSDAEEGLMIKIPTLIDQLDSIVRRQGLFLKRIKQQGRGVPMRDIVALEESYKSSYKKCKNPYSIGVSLIELMEERKLISFINMDSSKVEKIITKKDEYYYQKKTNYAYCLFDIRKLPMKLYLPMVSPPRRWEPDNDANPEKLSMSNVNGGYLNKKLSDLHTRYRLISTVDTARFNIHFERVDDCNQLCDVMNTLQEQPFEINSKWLHYIMNNRNKFVEEGLLMPEFLCRINMDDVISIIRELYLESGESTHKLIKMDDIINQITKNIQQARYESLILSIAIAYDGYQFYLPAFLDFRGRIYRVGILHFHERDLVRSLLVFATNEKLEVPIDVAKIKYLQSTACHVNSRNSYESAKLGGLEIIQLMTGHTMNDMIYTTTLLEAKNPFQALSQIFGLYHNYPDLYKDSGMSEMKDAKDMEEYYHYLLRNSPITQDASASAFQIMGLLLLDESIANNTNLFPAYEKNDIYENFRLELLEFLSQKSDITESFFNYLKKHLSRKIVKMIFMPLIYGKTLISTIRDLKKNLGSLITHKESVMLAKHCFSFWQEKYSHMYSLIMLIRSIGWFVSYMDRSVMYMSSYSLTLQDYVNMENIKIWIYDRKKKKRRQVTLRMDSNKRDRRKTEISTFVNFIHQKDAEIAMTLVKTMKEAGKQRFQDKSMPLYTVHDNFISTTNYCGDIAYLYIHAFLKCLGDPLSIINNYLYTNLVRPYKETMILKDLTAAEIVKCFSTIIPEAVLEKVLLFNIDSNKSKLSKADVKKLTDKVAYILKLYSQYTKQVAGPCLNYVDSHMHTQEYIYKCYVSNMEDFQNKIRSNYNNKEIYNYAVFY